MVTPRNRKPLVPVNGTFDIEARAAIAGNPNARLSWFLMASYAYYIQHESLLSDTLYDEICVWLLAHFDTVEHPNKSLVTPDMLGAATGYNLSVDDYPLRVQVAAETLMRELAAHRNAAQPETQRRAVPMSQPATPRKVAPRLRHLDFETFYSDEYSLSKMTAEEYVRDPRFQVIGFAIRDDDTRAVWHTGDDAAIAAAIYAVDWENTILNGHNMSEFDSLVLTHHFKVRPRFWQCTLQMARALHGPRTPDGKNISNALGALAKMHGLPAKGNEVVMAKGKRREDFTPSELAAYGRYCCNDTDLTRDLYHILRKKLPASELQLAHLCTNMFADARLALDNTLLRTMQDDLAVRKSGLLGQVADMLGVAPDLPHDARMTETQRMLRSDATFAKILEEEFGIEPPRKPSPKKRDADGNPLMVYAFAKTDEAMTDLLEDEDEEVQALAAARLGVKSTIAESRLERLVGISTRGLLPVPLVFGRTHTHRLAGGGKINLQNMNRVAGVKATRQEGGKTVPGTRADTLIHTPDGYKRLWKTNATTKQCATVDRAIYDLKRTRIAGLRDAIQAPKGKKLVVADSANIELRVCHLLCGQMDTIEKLRGGIDLYCDFATDLYGYIVTKAMERERQHGKVGHLQLQFQSGGGAFRRAARIMGGIKLAQAEADETVRVYRKKHAEIAKGWRRGQQAIEDMFNGNSGYLDQWGLCRIDKDKIWLPNGMPLNFFNLREVVFEGEDKPTWVYDDKETRGMKKLYGGKVIQGLTQALARIVVMEQMLEIEKRWGGHTLGSNGVVLTVHDEVVALVDEDDAEECLAWMLACMSQAPKWWPELPVKAEGGIGDRYADAK